MSKAILLTSTLAAAALTFTSLAAEAKVSSVSEFRGYQNCLEAASNQSRGLVPTRSYFIQKDGAAAEYFINATRWEAGERSDVRINCQTVARGHRLVDANIEAGSFIADPRTSVRVEVAQN